MKQAFLKSSLFQRHLSTVAPGQVRLVLFERLQGHLAMAICEVTSAKEVLSPEGMSKWVK